MSYRIEFAVLSEQKPDCRFGLTLHNLSDQDLHDWSLYFVIDRYIQPMSVTNGQLTQVGSLCSIVPTEKYCQPMATFIVSSSSKPRLTISTPMG